MVNWRRFGGSILVLSLLLPAAAAAQVGDGTFDYTGTGNAFNWWFNGPGASNITSVAAGGAYRGDLVLDVPITGFGPAVDAYCVDFLHFTSSGAPRVYVTALDNVTAANTRYGNLVNYKKAAYLAEQLNPYLPSNSTTNQAQRALIHATMWHILNGFQPFSVYNGVGGWVDVASAANPWLAFADGFGSANLDGWRVVTDVAAPCASNGLPSACPDAGSQEFLVKVPPTTVPEPGSMTLLGIGLLGIARAMRRKRS